MIGLTISHYKILEKLGEGGMGVVYKAEDTKLKRTVALKFLPSELTRDEEAKKRFVHEAQAAAALDDPNICSIYEINEADGQTFIVMSYVEGLSLKEMIVDGPLKVEEAVEIAIQIASGLQAAHDKGIIHRDIKPANILISTKNKVRITDFGLAKLSNRTKVTQFGTALGTVAYMSPEQTRGVEVDKKTDIWSLGIVLFEMLTGQLPFRGDYDQAIIYSIMNEEPLKLTDLQSNIPLKLEEIIKKMLQKNSSYRYKHTYELLNDLNFLKAELDSGTEKNFSDVKKPNKSIAVLPFKDMSPKRDQDYLCEGFAEEMINSLTHVENLRVAARTSSFSFQGKDEDIRNIGRQLNVDSVLEGSVQKSGNQLRITVQLINVSDGYHLWSERFDRNIKDVFAVQDEISLAVVEKLKVELLEGEKEKVTKRYTHNEKAYELYLKGRYHWNNRTPKDMFLAVDFFQKAIDTDPNYATPYVGIADVFNMLAEFGFIEPHEGYMKSKVLLQKAMELDNMLSEIYASLALITYCYDWNLVAAETYARQSIELNSQNFYAHAVYAEILGAEGRYQEAIAEIQKGIELEPLYALGYSLYGILLGGSGRVEEGREQIQKSLSMEPNNPMILSWLGMSYLAKPAELEKAAEYLHKAASMGVTLAVGFLGMTQALAGKKEEALKSLGKLMKIEKEPFFSIPIKSLLYFKPGLRHFRSFKKKYCPSHLKAVIYLGLNMQEEALAEFEKSGNARDYLLPALFSLMFKYDIPWMKEITSQNRFQNLQSKIKIS